MRLTKAGAAAVRMRDEKIRALTARAKKAETGLQAALKREKAKDEKIRAKDEKIKKLNGDKRKLAASSRSANLRAKKAEQREARAKSALARQKEPAAKMKKENADLRRRLSAYEGPSVPPSKTRQKRNRDKKGEEEGEGGGGGGGGGGRPRRRPGGQPRRKAARREFVPDRHVVLEKPGGCDTPGCEGHIRVKGYSKRRVYDRPPPRRPQTYESQCPEWECAGCGCGGTVTEGTAVPLHMFEAESGDAEPDRPDPAGGADGAAAGAEPAGTGPNGAGQGPRQEEGKEEPQPQPRPQPQDAVVEAVRAAIGGADSGAGAPVNDIPDDPDKPFWLRLPLKGVFGLNLKSSVIKNWLYRVTIRKNREAHMDEEVEISEGHTSNVVRDAGLALRPGLMALIALLASAKVIHSDRTTYSKDGENWGLWIFFDPLRKIAVYWLSPDGDNAVLQKILGAWDGIIVCDGAPVFRKYRIQRCWAHILNEAKYLARNFPDNERVLYVSARLHKIFHDAKAFRGTAAERARKRHEFARRVRDLVDDYAGDPALAEFMTKLDNAALDLFLFIILPWVPPTNNPAEKLLREPVVLRKIRGALRSLAGVRAFCALLSCKTTWEMHGLRPLAEIRRVL